MSRDFSDVVTDEFMNEREPMFAGLIIGTIMFGVFLAFGLLVNPFSPFTPLFGLLMAVCALAFYQRFAYKRKVIDLAEAGRLKRWWYFYMVGLTVQKCGCATYPAPWTPKSDRVDVKAIEVETTREFWVRYDEGARWRYMPWATVMFRCYRCGKHFHVSGIQSGNGLRNAGSYSVKSTSQWKDREQPEFDEEVIDAEVAEGLHG